MRKARRKENADNARALTMNTTINYGLNEHCKVWGQQDNKGGRTARVWIAAGPQFRDMTPTLARTGALVGLREARNTNRSSSMVVDVSMDGLMPLGLALVI